MKKGSHHSLEAIKKMSEAHRGKRLSLETRKKISETHKDEKHPFWGKHHSVETKRKISLANKGRKLSAETKRKIGLASTGRILSIETRRKLSVFGKGKFVSLETGRKISKTKKAKHFHHSVESKKKLSLALKGEKSYLWRGGISFEPYGLAFTKELREKIRKRDNHRCQQCFREQSELFTKNMNGKIVNYKLNVHHIDSYKQNNEPVNLISLCKPCHCQTNFNREDWTNYFSEKVGDGKLD